MSEVKVYTFDEICESQDFNHDQEFTLKEDLEALQSKYDRVVKGLEKFVTKSNGLSIYVRNPVDELFLVKAGYEELLKKLDSIYDHQCDVEKLLKEVEK